jgi:hypothetical protein
MSGSKIAEAVKMREDLDRKIAELELEAITPVLAEFQAPSTQAFVSAVSAARDQLEGGFIFEQLGHVLTVMTNVETILAQRIEAAKPADPDEEAGALDFANPGTAWPE